MSDSVAEVMITFDAEGIIDRYGKQTNPDPKKPQDINYSYIYMVTRSKNAFSGNGGGNLALQVRTGEFIRWRENSPTYSYQAILCNFTVSSGADLLGPMQQSRIEINYAMPNMKDPTAKPTETQKVKVYSWRTEAQLEGTASYVFTVMLLDRDGNVVGYYKWDPTIQIRA